MNLPQARKEAVYLLSSFFFFLALFVSLFPDVVFFDMTFAKRDILRYYFPVWRFSVDCLKQGILPLWNPYNSYGTPFFADVQTLVLYPLTLILHLPDYRWAFNFFILVHLAMAGTFTMVWMREIRASRIASLLAGVAFAAGGYVMSAVNLTISLCSVVYFPLVLVCLRRSLNGGGILWQAAGAAILTLQYLGGDPSIVFCTILVCSLFTLFRLLREVFVLRRDARGPLFSAMRMLGLFIGFSAFHWMLFAEFLSLSSRAHPTFDVMTMWSVQLNDLLSFVLPYFSDSSLFFMDYWQRQSWLENGYMGVTVFVLAAAALKLRRTDMAGYLFLLFLLGVGLALGRFCLVYAFFYDWFPFFKYIRYPVRFLFIAHFAAACLAGLGLDALLSGKPSPAGNPKARWYAAFLVLAVLGVLASMWFSPWISGGFFSRMDPFMKEWTKLKWTMETTIDLVDPFLSNFKRTSVLLLFMLAGVVALTHLKLRKGLAAAFFFILVFGDMTEATNFEMRVDGDYLGRLGENMKIILKDDGLFRAHASPSASKLQTEPAEAPSIEHVLQKLLEMLCPNLLLPLRVSYTAGYDSLFLQDSVRMNEQGQSIQKPSEYRYLDMLNIKYLVSARKSLDEGYEKLRDGDPVSLYRNKKALPRAYLVPEAEIIADREEALKAILRPEFDPLERIFLEKPAPRPSGGAEDASLEGCVDIVHYGPNEARMEVRSPRAQWLFLSDSFYPGWKAWVDGRPVEIRRANYMFRAVPVPAGSSTVTWKYDPILFKIGTGLGLLCLFAVAVALRRERRL